MKRTLAALAFGAIGFAQSGHWEGKLKIPGHEFAITADLAKNTEGAWIGSMSVLNTSSIDVPLTDVTVQGSEVTFKSNLPEPASFAGAISADGAAISGSASNSQGDAPFELTRSGEPSVKVPPPSSSLPKEFEGTWEGALDVDGRTVRVRIKLLDGANGKAAATLTTLDQNAMEIPASTVTIGGNRIQIESRAISGRYTGMLTASGAIEGEWSEGQSSLPLALKRQ